MTKSRRNKLNARKHFGIDGNPSLVLHHVDTTMRERDPNRYHQWNFNDLVVMGRGEHTRLHNKGNKRHLGHHHSEEARRKIADAESKRVRCIETGQEFKSAKEASEFFGLCNRAVSMNIQHGYRTRSGYTFEYID